MCGYVHTDEHLAVGDAFDSPIYAKPTRQKRTEIAVYVWLWQGYL